MAGQVSGTLSELGQKALTTPAGAVNKGVLHFYSGFHHRVFVSLKGECGAPIHSPAECFSFQSQHVTHLYWMSYGPPSYFNPRRARKSDFLCNIPNLPLPTVNVSDGFT